MTKARVRRVKGLQVEYRGGLILSRWGTKIACGSEHHSLFREIELLADLGLVVAREIPLNTLAGLLTGSYSLHGGVVRDAGGRIVSHLITSGPFDLVKTLVPGVNTLTSLVGSGQLYSLAKDVEQVRQMVSTVLTVSTAGAVLSGVGLVASVAGTAFLSRKLDSVQRQLEHIERLLNDQHLSVLKGAVDSLKHAENAADRETRRALLVSAKTDFSKSAHFYGSQFADPRSVNEVIVLEEPFALASIGSAICLSELGMYGAAAADFEGHCDRWRPLARKHVSKYLLGDAPYRLLDGAYADDLPARELADTLDYVNSEQKSWSRIDELRKEKAGRGLNFPKPWGDKEKEDKAAIQVARTLRAKDAVLDSYGEHLRFLDAKKISVGAFATAANEERKALGCDAVCLLGMAA
jgi:hypothetical protein